MKNVRAFLKNHTDKQDAYRKMRILILNGSPHPKGNTKQMVDAFKEGAESVGHQVSIHSVSGKKRWTERKKL